MSGASDTTPLLVATGLVKTFGGGLSGAGVTAVDDVSLDVRRGETVALVGESGSGKSTLGRLVNRLIEADAGEIRLEGVDVRTLRGDDRRRLSQRVQMVFQDPMASLNPRHRIIDTMARPLRLHGLVRSKEEARAKATALLAEVGIGPEALDRFPHEFSGGQRQRIGIARALSVGPDLLICDEPVSALDVSVQAQIITLLEELKRRHNLAQLFIAHDLALVRRIADRVAVMYRGRIVEIGDTEAMFRNPSHPYTRALLAAVPRIGHPPDPADPTAGQGMIPQGDGCNYAPRCPLARPMCGTARPPLTEQRSGLSAACHFPTDDPVGGTSTGQGMERARRIAVFSAALAEIMHN